MVLIKNRVVSRMVLIVPFLASFLLITSFSATYGQKVREEAPPFRERLFYGGSFGLQFGTYTNIDISPVVGFWILPRLNVAAGPKYRFYKNPYGRTDIYGGRAYTQFVVIQDLNNMIPAGIHLGFFLHAEDELLSLQSSFWLNTQGISDRFFLNTGLAGFGVSQPMGRRSSFNIMALWALNDSEFGLYSNPEIRFTFIF